MTTWATFREAVRQAVVSASGVVSDAVVWGNAGQPIANPVVRLFVTSAKSAVGEARLVQVENEDGDYNLTASIVTDVTVQVRTETVDNATAADALQVAEYTKLGFALQAPDALLAAQAVVQVDQGGECFDVSFIDGDRMLAARTFDWRLRFGLTRTDPTPRGTIEHVKVSGTIDVPPEVTIPEETLSRPEDEP